MGKRQLYFVWFGIFITWAIYRAYFNLPDGIDEFLIKPLVFTAPIFYLVLFREKKKLGELGLAQKPKDFLLDLYIGVVIGILFALEGVMANYIKNGQVTFAPILAMGASGGVLPFLLINLSTSFWEEILGRGYLYKRLKDISGNQMYAALFSSFLFLLLHVPILFTRLHLRGMSLIIYPVSILILSVTNCYLYSLRKSLTLPILIHTFWNMTVALYL